MKDRIGWWRDEKFVAVEGEMGLDVEVEGVWTLYLSNTMIDFSH